MLGKKIKELRKKRGITQSELADVLGVSTSMVGMYETDSRNPSYDVLIKIANYFNVSIDYLLSRFGLYIGNFIQKERVEQDISIEELANEIGKNQQEICRYEANLKPINKTILKKIANVFGMSTEEFLCKHNFSELRFSSPFLGVDGDVIKSEVEIAIKETGNPFDKEIQSHKIAAYLDGVELTKEEMEDLKKYIDFLLSKRKE